MCRLDLGAQMAVQSNRKKRSTFTINFVKPLSTASGKTSGLRESLLFGPCLMGAQHHNSNSWVVWSFRSSIPFRGLSLLDIYFYMRMIVSLVV